LHPYCIAVDPISSLLACKTLRELGGATNT
jgi:hypothetical protein